MRVIALTMCMLLVCVNFAEARPRHRKAGKGRKASVTKRHHSGRIARSVPCPVCVPPPTCPDVVKVMTAEEVDAESSIDSAFHRQFTQWLSQHPEANQSPELAAVVRDISARWYRRGREDAKRK